MDSSDTGATDQCSSDSIASHDCHPSSTFMDSCDTGVPNHCPPDSIARHNFPSDSTFMDSNIIGTKRILVPSGFYTSQPASNPHVLPNDTKHKYVAFWGADGKLYYARAYPKYVIYCIPLAFLLFVGVALGLFFGLKNHTCPSNL